MSEKPSYEQMAEEAWDFLYEEGHGSDKSLMKDKLADVVKMQRQAIVTARVLRWVAVFIMGATIFALDVSHHVSRFAKIIGGG